MPTAHSISIVVPTLNRPAHLEALVRALAELPLEDAQLIAELIVVDQSDVGTSAPDLTGAPCPVRHLRRAYRNVSRARNEGAAAADAELVLFVDDDCRPLPGCIAAHLAAHAAASVVVTGPVLPPGGRMVAAAELGERACQELRDGLRIRGDVDFAYAPAQVGSGNLSLRRAVLEQAGGFDERLGRFNEDAELSHRLKRIGARLRYEPKAAVIHLHAAEGGNRAFASDTDAIAQMIVDSVYYHARIRAGVRGTAAGLWQLFRQQALNRGAIEDGTLLRRTATFARAALIAARGTAGR